MEKKLVTVRQKANSSELLTQTSIMVKNTLSIVSSVYNVHCLKCVPMKVTKVTKCKGFYFFNLKKSQENNLKLNIFSCRPLQTVN